VLWLLVDKQSNQTVSGHVIDRVAFVLTSAKLGTGRGIVVDHFHPVHIHFGQVIGTRLRSGKHQIPGLDL
jgi:hypothetical protein